jgi:hypothetical protein
MRQSLANSSDTARAFGASVDMETRGKALCLVVGNRKSPLAAINAAGGQVAVVLTPRKMLAVIELSLLSQVQRHRDVVLAGPVSVDQGRFAQFAQMMGAKSPA